MKIGRAAWTIIGLALVGLGFLGLVTPGLPSTVFMIMALFCFKKGSSRFENWLLAHPLFGKTLRDWEEHKSISLRTKWIAVSTMWAFGAVSVILIPVLWVKMFVLALCAFATWYIASRRTTVGASVVTETASDSAAA